MGSHFSPLERSSYPSHSYRRTLEKERDFSQSTGQEMNVFEMGHNEPSLKAAKFAVF